MRFLSTLDFCASKPERAKALGGRRKRAFSRAGSAFCAALLLSTLTLFSTTHLLAAAPGAGTTFDESRVNYEPPPTERRSGFAMGVSTGFGVGSYSGYPLEVAALNDPDAKQTTGPGLATHLGLWVGAAPRDFFSFGLGFSLMSTRGQNTGVDTAMILHLEAFPLFYRGGLYQDLGLVFEGGLGMGLMAKPDDKKFDDPIANGGSMSHVNFGLVWEPLRFWHFSAGPVANYVYGFSQTMTVHQGTLGFRMALYGKQPKKKKAAAQSAGFGSSQAF